jgi:hypothetical protein
MLGSNNPSSWPRIIIIILTIALTNDIALTLNYAARNAENLGLVQQKNARFHGFIRVG